MDDPFDIQAEGFNASIHRAIGLRWEPLNREWFPADSEESVDWHWRSFQFVFPLDDPRSLPPLAGALPTADAAIVARYVAHAKDLAGSTVLTAKDGYSVHLPTMDSEPEIEVRQSPKDATVGFLTMFRQAHNGHEAASFKKVYDILGQRLHAEGRPMDSIREWRKAERKMMRVHLDQLLLEGAVRKGIVPPSSANHWRSHPEAYGPLPLELLNALFYGDAIHWGEERSVIQSWSEAGPLIAVKRQFDALRAATQLAHLYVGFAGLAELLHPPA